MNEFRESAERERRTRVSDVVIDTPDMASASGAAAPANRYSYVGVTLRAIKRK
jgi:hypothetical protein